MSSCKPVFIPKQRPAKRATVVQTQPELRCDQGDGKYAGGSIAMRRPASAQPCGNIDFVKVEVVARSERRDIASTTGWFSSFRGPSQGRRESAWESVCRDLWVASVSLPRRKHEHVFPRT